MHLICLGLIKLGSCGGYFVQEYVIMHIWL